MRLTRRDAVLALASGVGGGVAMAAVPDHEDSATGESPSDEALGTLVAAAEVVYPTTVEGVETFTREYVRGLPRERQRRVATTADALDGYTRRTLGGSFATRPYGARDTVLRTLGVDRVHPDPDGAFPERVRFYVVNQLLYGLYSSPTGSRLVGIENPVGHPGGHQSYQRGPSE